MKTEKYLCVYVPKYKRYSGYKRYRITKNEIYNGCLNGKGNIVVKNDYGEYKAYSIGCFEKLN